MKTFATEPRMEPRRYRPCPVCGGNFFSLRWRLEGFSFSRCRTCGLAQQNPQPLPDAVLDRYGQSYLEYEVERQFDFRDLERRTLQDLGFPVLAEVFLAQAARTGQAPRILDIGCATGALLADFSAAGWECLGLEPCRPAAEYAQERYGLDVRSEPFSMRLLGGPGLEPASFDCVHASHVIEHVPDPAEFLDAAVSLLKPEGRLLLTTPNAAGFQARLLGPAWRSAIFDHLYLFRKRDLLALLSARGLRIERLVTWGGWAAGLRPSYVKKPLDRLAKRLGLGDVMAVMARRY